MTTLPSPSLDPHGQRLVLDLFSPADFASTLLAAGVTQCYHVRKVEKYDAVDLFGHVDLVVTAQRADHIVRYKQMLGQDLLDVIRDNLSVIEHRENERLAELRALGLTVTPGTWRALEPLQGSASEAG